MAECPRPLRAPVLLVDDDESTRIAFAAVLDAVGVPTLLASNGEEALEVLGTTELPSVIFLDVAMPIMDGLAFRLALLEDPRFARIPVVIVSGWVLPADWRARLKAVAVLRKPVELVEVEGLLAKYGGTS